MVIFSSTRSGRVQKSVKNKRKKNFLTDVFRAVIPIPVIKRAEKVNGIVLSGQGRDKM